MKGTKSWPAGDRSNMARFDFRGRINDEELLNENRSCGLGIHYDFTFHV